jgi:glucose dehydrogenase
MLPMGVIAAAAVLVGTMSGRADGPGDWAAYSGDKAATKYSALDQINADTVKNLRIPRRSRRPTTSTRR